MSTYEIFTSESVSEGHPDKLADQISDALLDEFLKQDKHSRVAIETLLTRGLAIVAGEVTTTDAYVDINKIVRQTINEVGYTDTELGFDGNTCGVMVAIQEQSPDIAMGVDRGGAGDQGMMFGFACDDTEELMPMPISLSHKLSRRLAAVRKDGTLPFLRPDGKSQVSVRYENNRPVAVETVVVSSQHSPDVAHKTLTDAIIEEVVRKEIPSHLFDKNTRFLINPTGRFVVGGPMGDSGLTGRKIIVDTYGGWGRHGGGAFSGKDPSKVDRSACYYARYIAKNIVAAGLANRCEVQVAYAIGVAAPVSIHVTTFGTGKVSDDSLEKLVRAHFDCRPAALIRELDLLRPIYKPTAAYGHFGRTESTFSWEKTDKAAALKESAKSV